MKNLLILLFTIFITTSCVSKDLEPEPTTLKGQVSLNLKFNESLTSRATDNSDFAASKALEVKLNNIIVFVFNEDNSVDLIQNILITDLNKNNISFNSKVGDKKNILLLANTNAEQFANCQTRESVAAISISLEQTQVLMKSEINNINIQANTNVVKNAILNRIVAKIQVSEITNDTYLNGRLIINKVGIAEHYSNYTLSGIGAGSILFNTIEGFTDNYNSANTNYFYIYPETPSKTKVIIQATLDGKTVYYPIVINKDQIGTIIDNTNKGKIISNVVYNLTVNIKSKGVVNPTDIIDPSTLEVGITIADWLYIVNQNVNI